MIILKYLKENAFPISIIIVMLFLIGVSPASQLPDLVPTTGEQTLQSIRTDPADVIMINIWATWCQPCREEFPDMLKAREKYGDRLKLVLISTDFKRNFTEAREFLSQQGVDFTSYIKDQNDQDFIRSFHPEWSGALPATFIFDRNNELRDFWIGKADFKKFCDAIDPVLKDEVTQTLRTTE